MRAEYGFVVVETGDVEGRVALGAGLVGVCSDIEEDGAHFAVLVFGCVVERGVVGGVLVLGVRLGELEGEHVDALHLVLHAA